MEFLEDLKKINKITDNQFKDILSYINNNKFNTVKDIITYDKFCIENEIEIETGRSIRKLLNFIFDVIIENREESITFFEKEILSNYIDDKEIKSSWEKIKTNINILDKLLIIRKEKYLRNRIPNLRNFSLMCEIRPIFNIDKTSIQELIFPIILRIKDSDDIRPKILEIDEEDLHLIKKEVDNAIKKVDIIKERFKDSGQRN